MKGKLFLIPCGLSEGNHVDWIAPSTLQTALELRYFIVENERSARRFLRSLSSSFPIDDSHFAVIDKHQSVSAASFLQPCLNGHSVGLISEAGCPAIADPGEEVVAHAQKIGIAVKPFVGPSSILLTLMASGLNGENFAFLGYLPIEKGQRSARINGLIQTISSIKQTQLFMDTPFRNNTLLGDVLTSAPVHFRLTIAKNITTSGESILTKTIGEWRQNPPDLHKQLVMFALGL